LKKKLINSLQKIMMSYSFLSITKTLPNTDPPIESYDLFVFLLYHNNIILKYKTNYLMRFFFS